MKKKKIFGFLGLVFLSLVSCDKDYNTVGADLVDESNYEFEKYPVENLKAFSRATGVVQTNNMPINALGVFSDPVFGTTKAHFVTQLELNSADPDFGVDAQIQSTDSVYLYIPYFTSDDTVTDSDGNTTYTLDSIQGNLTESFDLKIFESNYLINTFDPTSPSETQKYYSNQKDIIENFLGSQLNTSTNTSENSNFKFSSNEIIIYESDGNGGFVNSNGNVTSNPSEWIVKERLEPGMWINLDKTFFNQKMLQNATSENLFNNNNFKQYFRGLYFQTNQNTGGALAKLDFSSGYIVMQYHSRDAAGSDLEKNEIQINLSGNTINFLEDDLSTITEGGYQAALDPSSANEDYLYLKGGNGSIAFIDLFGTDDVDGNGIPDELDKLRDSDWLVNDAILTIKVANKNNKINSSQENSPNDGFALGNEPNRVYLYDVTNKTVLLDYTNDASTSSDVKYNKYYFGGLLEVDENKEGMQYRFSLLYYINNLIKTTDVNDLKNIRLGLVVTETINNVANYSLQAGISNSLPVTLPLSSSATSIDFVPLSSVMNPLGTVLYGVNHPDDSKKMKLEIYFTKPKSN